MLSVLTCVLVAVLLVTVGMLSFFVYKGATLFSVDSCLARHSDLVGFDSHDDLLFFCEYLYAPTD